MKKYYFSMLFVCTLLFPLLMSAQGATCADMQPFCTDSATGFPASVNTGDIDTLGCLKRTPNPVWYYMQIADPGDLEISLTNATLQGDALDIDFIVLGPFQDLAEAQNQCGNYVVEEAPCPLSEICANGVPCDYSSCCTSPCPGSGLCPDGSSCESGDSCNSCDENIYQESCCLTGNGIDCSYRPGTSAEIANIPNAQTGEVYVLMITNFLGMPTNISANITDGTATTNCSIVPEISVCRDVAFFQQDPNDPSNFINLPTTIDCTDPSIVLIAEPAQIPNDILPQPNDFTTPAFGIEIVTDGNSETENTLEIKNFLNGGGPPGFLYDIGEVPNNRNPYVFYGEFINPNNQYSFIWCDDAGTGTFEYNVIDYANGNIMASGVFDHANEGNCITVNIGTPTGTASYAGNGIITDIGDGTAVFDPTSLNPGTYNITYSWNDDNGDCMGQQTQSIEVTCTGCAVSGGEIVGDDMINICADDMSVTLTTINEITAPNLPVVLWGLWILDDPLNMTAIPTGPIPPDALPFTHDNYVGVLEDPNGIVISGPNVIIPPDGTGITYYVAPLIGTLSPDGNNGLIDTQCSGLNPQEGYTVYMNPPINVSSTSTNCNFTATISGGYPRVDPTADYSWEYTASDGSVVTGTGSDINISANADDCYEISVTDDGIGCGFSITPPFCSMGCECSADAGTFTNNGEILCITDEFTMTSNNDYMGSHENGSPSDIAGPNSDGDSFNGVGYALFSDVPTGQTIIPGADQDPNFIALLGSSPANAGGTAQSAGFSVGETWGNVTIQTNTTYYVTTVYSFDVDDDIYALGLGNLNCFDSNPDQAIPVTFIDSIQTTITQSCNINGTADISIQITGGLPGFDNTNVYTITSTAGPQGTVPANGTYTISDYPLGEPFTVVIGDGLCPSVNIQEFAILGPTIQITGSTDVSCNGASDGTASILPGSGTQPYDIEWSHGVTDSLVLVSLGMGIYNVTVTDDLGCFVVSEDIIIEEATSLMTSAVADSTSCEGANDGVITATTMGGTEPYAYTWEGIGLSTNPQGGFAAGTYAYTVTDNKGCIATGSATIEEPIDPGASITGTQPTCFGTNTGSMEGFGSGGTPPYTYLWSNGQTSQTITDLAVGQYSLTITDSKGCTAEAVETLSQPGMLTVGIQPISDASCEGSMDGELEATNNNGGTPPYTYTWSHDANLNSPNATNLNPDTYIVTITDANGCLDIASETVNQTVNIIESGSTVNDALCEGGEGSITANFTGSTNTPFTYTWSHDPTLNDPNATGLPADVTYNVTVTDNVGCTSSATFFIDQPEGLIFGTNVDKDISCNNENDGEASIINVSGGTPDYTYEWDNGEMTVTAIGLSGGTHTVTVTDANGCFSTGSVEIINPEPLTHSASSSGEIECNGGTGSISLIAEGGTPDVAGNYDYQWSANTGGQVAATAVNLVANTLYSYTITDDNGCTDTGERTLIEPPLLVATLDSQTDIDCNGNSTGQATVSATGGEINSPDTDYTFEWSASANNQTGNTATDLPAGTHTVTITDSNDCTDTLNINITQPDLLEVNIDIDNNVSCNGEDDGEATAIATGGTVNSPADYTFQWDANAGSQNMATATGLMANVTYFVTVTDNNNCTEFGQITLTEPTALDINVVQDKPISCNGGSDGEATAMPTGGTPDYSYEWSTGDTTPSVTGLTAEMHYVTITDANNCEAIDSVLIDDVAELTVTVDLGNDVNCNGESDGSATANPIGGTPDAAGNYTYQWSASANNQPTQTADNLPAGMHSVTVTDAKNCTAIGMIEIMQPDTPLSLEITDELPVSCNGGSDGSATVVPMGGTPDAAGEYSYEWSNGQMIDTATDLPAGTHTVTVTDANGCPDTGEVTITEPTLLEITEIIIDNNVSCNGENDGEATAVATGGTVDSPADYTFQWDANVGNQTSATATGLMADIEYFVTVTDNNNCTATRSIQLTQPTPITATIDTIHVTCNGFSDGSATANPTGGTPDVNGNYAYQWSANAGGVFTQTASNLPAGDYTVTITDDNNCPIVETVTINEPPLLTLSISDTLNVSCNGLTDGTATVTPTGGTPPYVYEWGGSGETDSTAVLLPAGVHIVTVTDINNCTETAEITITEPDELLVSLQDGATNPSCFGLSDGVIMPTVEGGTPPYTYAWSDGQTTEVADSLPAGSHSLIVTDAKGCTANDNITLMQPPSIELQVNTQQTLCRESCDGTASVIANGGAGGFTYLWDNGETTDNASALCAGEHTVTVTDASGCEVVDTFNIEPAAPIFPVGFSEEVSCFDGNDGSITLEPTGGVPPYTYEWFASDGMSLGTDSGPSSSIENLVAGIYTAIITDANGCSQPANITVREPLAQLTLTTSGQGTSCNSGDDGFVTVEPTGGTPSYSYQWSAEAGFQDTQTALNLPLGTYSVTVTDAKGCMATAQESINEPSLVGFSLSSIPATCFGDANGIIVMENPVGGIPPYMFSLEPDFINADTTTTEFYGLEAGLYTVYVKDGGGCVYEQEVVVDQPFEVIVDAGMDETILFGDSVELFAQINLPPGHDFTITWADTIGLSCAECDNPIASPLDDMTYIVKADNGECQYFDEITVFVDRDRDVFIPNIFSPNGDGSNDVFMIFGGAGVERVISFRIYDRWGEMLYEAENFTTNDPAYGWDGMYRDQRLNPGVFVYVAEIEFIDGTILPYKGNVTLVR